VPDNNDDYIEFVNRLSSQSHNKGLNRIEQPNGNTKQDELIYDNVDGRGNVQEDHYMSYSNNIDLSEEQYMPLNTNTSGDDTYQPLTQSQPNETEDTYQALNNASLSSGPYNQQYDQEVLYGNIINDDALYGNIQNSKLRWQLFTNDILFYYLEKIFLFSVFFNPITHRNSQHPDKKSN